MLDVIQLAEAVAAELAEYGAEVRLAPEFTPSDLKEMKVVVVPVGVAHSLLSRAHREDALQVQVGVLKRTTEDEVVDLVSFVEGLAVGFLGKVLGGCARCTKTEHVPLYVPEHLRERRQFTGVVELTFKEIVHDPGGRI